MWKPTSEMSNNPYNSTPTSPKSPEDTGPNRFQTEKNNSEMETGISSDSNSLPADIMKDPPNNPPENQVQSSNQPPPEGPNVSQEPGNPQPSSPPNNSENNPPSFSPENIHVPYVPPAPDTNTYSPPTTPPEGGDYNQPPEASATTRRERRIRDYEREALEAINAICRRDEERARERYRGGLFARVRKWFHREGTRREAQTLEEAGRWANHPRWRRWAKIGLKIAGGFGLAAAMTFTGGAGLLLTPLLWTAGVREGWDGILESIEQLGWGRNRTRAELAAQAQLTERIENLKNLVRERGRELTEREFAQALHEMLEAEREVIATQVTNMTSERRWATGRAIASAVATIGTGMITGIPFGTADYGPTEVKNIYNQGTGVFLDDRHRVFWNLKDGLHYLYNSPEEMYNIITTPKLGLWHITTDVFSRAGHILGHGLTASSIIGLGASAAYVLGRWIEQNMERLDEPERGAYYGYPYTERRPLYDPTYTPEISAGGATETEEVQPPPERSVESDRRAFEEYLGRQRPEYLEELRELNRELPPMSENCRFVICIPASFAEYRNIYRTLEQYLNQTDRRGNPLPPESFEILVLVNGHENRREDINRTIQEIQRFKNTNPQIKVNVVSKIFEPNVPIGRIRKYVNDLALLRAQARERANAPLILVSNDADAVEIEREYLAKAEEAFERDPRLEMIAGKVDYSREGFRRYPYLYVARRMWQAIDTVMRFRRYSDFLPKTLGLNSFIRADSYARAGGYRENMKVAEDLYLARDISANRGDREAVQYHRILLRTSPRRDLDAIRRGLPIIQSYDNFGAVEELREVAIEPEALERLEIGSREFRRRLNYEASEMFYRGCFLPFFWYLFDRHPEVVRRRQEQGANANVQDLERRLRRSPEVGDRAFRKAATVFDRAMGLLGLRGRYRIYQRRDGGYQIEITDTRRLEERVRRFLSPAEGEQNPEGEGGR